VCSDSEQLCFVAFLILIVMGKVNRSFITGVYFMELNWSMFRGNYGSIV
jgi:hypothetical protein